jgi:hypothetical protein
MVIVQVMSPAHALGALEPGAAFASLLFGPPCCTELSSCLSLLERPVKTSLRRALMRLFLLSRAPATSSALAFAFSPAKSPL